MWSLIFMITFIAQFISAHNQETMKKDTEDLGVVASSVALEAMTVSVRCGEKNSNDQACRRCDKNHQGRLVG
jgi:hypothetical protein